MFQELLIGSKDAKRHRCKASIINNNPLSPCEREEFQCENDYSNIRNSGEGATHVVLSNNSCQFSLNYCEVSAHPSSGTMFHILPHRGEGIKEILKRTYSLINLFSYSPRKRAAFTLAEVLITLGIIGVVAAMTIPGFVTDYQKKVTATRLKAAYSQINQALVMAQAQYGDTAGWEKDANKILLEYIAPNLKSEKYTRDDDYNYTNTMCNNEQTYKFLNGGGMGVPFNSMSPSIKLANGVCVSLNRIENQTAEYLFVDINGPNPPNINGKDLFAFRLKFNEGKIVPDGDGFSSSYIKTPDYSHNCNKATTGNFCAKVIMDNGWEIPDDYPW